MAGALTAMIAAAFSGVTPDPYFEYTTLLLPGNGTNGAQNNTFLDGSTNNFTITRNGNTTQGTFSPFSQTGWGNYFSGVSDFLSYSTITLGSSFTIEFFVYFPNTPSANSIIISNFGAGGTNWIGVSNTAVSLSYSGTTRTFSFTPAGGTWYYVQIINSSSSLTCYVNGSQIGTSQTGPSSFTVDRIAGYTGVGLTGYLSNVRVNSTALAVSALPTSPLTNVANTVLLTCQSNRFVDNSGSPLTLTRGGSVSVVAFSPFNPTASWSAATNGGSGYFDNSGDYLTAPASSNLALGTSAFTLEAWYYPLSFSTDAIFESRSSAASAGGYSFLNTSDGKLNVYQAGGFLGASSTGLTLNAWNHVAIVRSGTGTNQTTYYINGVSVGTITFSANLTDASTVATYIGGSSNGTELVHGYLCDARIVKGTAVYTGNFTPPTAPLTAITNTSLLLNFTNAGIYDATSKNDLETVGNAQISTAISAKWGSGSMSFDGTGDWLKARLDDPLVYFGSGDWTVEGWVYLNNTTGTQSFIVGQSNFSTAANASYSFYVTGSSAGDVFIGSTNYALGAAGLSATTWTHCAWVRSGSTMTFYRGGTSITSVSVGTGSINNGTTNPLTIGAANNGTSPLNGYIQDLRITKGYARYTTNFTPPTAAFPTL